MKFRDLISELLDELDKKDPSTVVSLGLADKTSTLIGEILSLIRNEDQEDIRRKSDRTS
jgi:hypothetical protein